MFATTSEVQNFFEETEGVLSSTEYTQEDDATTGTELKLDFMSETANLIFMSIGVLAILGNALVIFIATTSSSMKKLQSNILILSQSSIDLVCGVCIIMYYIPYGLLKPNTVTLIWCKLFMSGFAVDSSMMASTYNLILITFEKYLMIVHPVKHLNWLTAKKIKLFILFAVMLGPAIPLVIPVIADVRNDQCQGYILLRPRGKALIGIANIIMVVIVPITITIYVYTYIFVHLRKLRKQRNEVNQQTNKNVTSKAEMNTLKTSMCIVGVCYCFCHFPRVVAISLFVRAQFTPELRMLSNAIAAFGYLNSAVNPFIYALKHERFKKELSKLIKCGKNMQVGASSVVPTASDARF